ncbi:glutathione S-transferase family protein [Roseomonas eburnea]|uniref:Glutathione S-transferase family protein n=1 Tax=Neoroseomonas eburnea TaxID=1346889 RepID=A0A9X9XJ80_9PROT|nr:glutathione S-transferase family protein [Neoroseomonas eburnea]MBR0683766.1 glutathione S-transferase family protein [Neoroseomonas eburnea]
MTYILHGDRGSGSAPIEMVLAEIGAAVELRPVPLATDAQLAAEYRRINPMGRIPTLILPDGTVVTETLAILLTLADRHPEAALLPPPGDSARATALRWMVLAGAEGYPHVTRYDYPERFSADPAHAEAIRTRAQEMYRDLWRLVEAEAGLTGDPAAPFLLGARFTMADAYIAVLSRWLKGAAWLPEHCPRLAALGRAVATRPRIAPVWQRHFPA